MTDLGKIPLLAALVTLQDHCCEESWATETDSKSEGLCGGVYLCAMRRVGTRENAALDAVRDFAAKVLASFDREIKQADADMESSAHVAWLEDWRAEMVTAIRGDDGPAFFGEPLADKLESSDD